MFTGIVAARGRIEKVESLAGSGNDGAAGLRLTIAAAELGVDDLGIGDSVAIQGACMTAIAVRDNSFVVEISAESLSKTVGLDRPGEVNLEKAMRLSDRVGGHLVTGHVDGLGEVVRFEPVGESWALEIGVAPALARYFAYKGSAGVNGVSLTVNNVEDRAEGTVFSINLIPHTMAVTTLGALKVGDRVNLEVDLMARYVERMLGQVQLPGR
ncbi:MAG: riboflavin synthase [Burkholderiaceae bacterium]|nr:riboflavin synthase [Burkholderiaceae bacterium]